MSPPDSATQPSPYEILLGEVDRVIGEWRELVNDEPWNALPPSDLVDSLPEILPRIFRLARAGEKQMDADLRECVAQSHGLTRRKSALPLRAVADEWNHVRRACWKVLRRSQLPEPMTQEALSRPEAQLSRWAACAASLLLSCAAAASAQTRPLPGYAARTAGDQHRIEADAVARPDSARMMRHARTLAREPHVAGTAAQARTRDYVIDEMRAMGLDTEVRAYLVWMPHPTRAGLWRVAPDTLELPLVEPPIAADPWSQQPQYPTVNGYSGSGDVSGEVVYVNYGLPSDYATLDSLGVSVRGRMVLARYGRSFRGIKAREAEQRGAVGLLLYSDPLDDGFARGDEYPDGPMRPPRSVQRGSVMNGTGDPTTPGWASVPGARRLPLDSLPVPRIPVVPVGWAHAAELLRGVRGADVPQAWQGGMPFRYHVGPGPVRARLVVELDSATNAYKEVWNTFGIVRGSEFPDEMIVIGAHRDAWGSGAADNVSGTASVLEAARAVAELVRAGHRPRRTIVFATWDAEEWGLIGSTEWVEDEAERLLAGGVAYLNQDVAALGPGFGAGGSPSLRSTLREVLRAVPHPRGGNVYDVWRAEAGIRADTLEPVMGDPGGGSDFAGFYNHLGIPHADWGFGGPWGVYHSAYDTPHWMEQFGDPAYRFHTTAARIGAAMLLRLANADVLPYDYAEYARTMRRHAFSLARQLAPLGGLSADALTGAIDGMEQEALAFAAVRDSVLALGRPSPAVLATTNAALRAVERQLTRPEGLRTRPWYRNLVYAADEDNGYATVVFPSVVEAARRDDAALAAAELTDLATRFERATAAIAAARAALLVVTPR